ncbi:MAG: hypothetical protein ANIMEMIM_00111 [Candidatus Argoarchaeum ethanivorans]|uniref:DUF362 domain-containing protein n=1 Tax=Candidatus Argoarchaeum ethanivorans TaxID=2608793 RepID=A0A811T910_9EURY|nr:MAG: hypothetical protein ANIMEMIM_00111 [Candidatus Argoarchaeum ethanivorans]
MSKVAILKTSPVTVIEDYNRLIHFAGYEKILPKENKTIIKINLSWSLFYPACSTPPWQLEGVLNALRNDSCKDIIAVENQTVVTHPWKGAYYNKWLPILSKYNVKFQPLTDVKWVPYKPKAEMLAMYDIFGEILIPKIFLGSNIIHLPTVKTHGHTTTTGAMKDAFGGLIPKYRHHAHKKIHEILVDLLAIQKEIHNGIFAVMDGCVCGNGAGPRTMEPFIGNVILASNDQVAIDAVAAKIMGFEPLEIDYIKMAHDRGLGMGDVDQIEIVSMDKKEFEMLNFSFRVKKSPIIMWDQILRKKTANIKWLHHLLFHSPVFKTFIFASEFYHDRFWYPVIGKRKIKEFMKTGWGELFKKYPYGEFPEYNEVKEWDPY